MIKMRHLLLLALACLSVPVVGGAEEQVAVDDRDLQSSTPRVLGDAYECDELFQEVKDDTPRPLGYEIRICVIPSVRTRQRDVVVRSIDEFSFYKNFGSAVQNVIDKGQENTEYLSIVLCVPGQLICSLKARLSNEFFYADKAGNITGSGTVSFEFSKDAFTGRRVLVQEKFELRRGGRSMIEEVAGGFAGTDTVAAVIPVVGVPRPKGDKKAKQTSDGGWWSTAPTWLKVLVILGSLVCAVLICCLCCICIYSMRRRIEDEQKEDEEKRDKEMENQDDYEEYTTHADDPVAASQATTAAAGNMEGEQPTDYDICFDADDHPGTMNLHDAMRNTMADFPPNTEYGPKLYRHIKQQLPDRKYYVVDDEDQPDVWREAGKKELIDLFRKEYEDIQRQ